MTDSKNFLNEALDGNGNNQSDMVRVYIDFSPLKLFVAAALNFKGARDTLVEAVSGGYYRWNKDTDMKEVFLKYENEYLSRTFLKHMLCTTDYRYLVILFRALSGSVRNMNLCVIKEYSNTSISEMFHWKDPQFAIDEISKFFRYHGNSETLLQDFLRFVPDGV